MLEKSVSVLLIDAGNSRLKWRLCQQGEITAAGICSAAVTELPNAADVNKVIVASVGRLDLWETALQVRYGKKLHWLHEPRENLAQFKHCYTQPQRLGVDRWLAMLGGRKYFAKGQLMVVDAGTALTIDLLDDQNQHLGGYIVPGLVMAANALFTNTDKVRPYQDEFFQGQVGLGQDTLSCVQAGILMQQQSFIQALAAQYPDFTLLISGGDGVNLAQALACPYYTNLVLDGLEMLCVGSLSA